MQIIDIPTEQTTAATDILLAIIAIILILNLRQSGRKVDLTKVKIWCWAFGFLALAATLGAIAHGITMSENINFIIWQPLNLSLGLAISLFVAGVIYDWNNYKLPGFLIPLLVATGVSFYMVTLLASGGFIIFILYEAVAMLIALSLYFILWKRKSLAGSGLMTVGILITIIAAAIQSIETIRITFIWEFDNNGLFHIIQIPGIMFLSTGLKTELNSRNKNISATTT